MKTTRLLFVALLLSAGALALPSAAAAQFDEDAWGCTPKKYTAGGRSEESKRYSGLPFAGGGTAFYTARLVGSVIRCGGASRISYQLYMNTAGFPRNRYVTYQLQSAGVHKKWKAACVIVYNTTKKHCTFKLDANQEIPRFGAKPLYQYRGSGVIRYLRLVHVAEQKDGGGTNLASKPATTELKLSAYKKQPKALW